MQSPPPPRVFYVLHVSSISISFCSEYSIRKKKERKKRFDHRVFDFRGVNSKRCYIHTTCTSPTLHLICPPKMLHKHCFQFVLGWLWYPGEIVFYYRLYDHQLHVMSFSTLCSCSLWRIDTFGSGIALYFAVRLNKPPFYIKPPSKVLQINKTPK